MFEDLKAQLDGLKAAIAGAFSDVSARLASLRASVSTIDAPIQGVFDQTSASVAEAKSALASKVGDLRDRIGALSA